MAAPNPNPNQSQPITAGLIAQILAQIPPPPSTPALPTNPTARPTNQVAATLPRPTSSHRPTVNIHIDSSTNINGHINYVQNPGPMDPQRLTGLITSAVTQVPEAKGKDMNLTVRDGIKIAGTKNLFVYGGGAATAERLRQTVWGARGVTPMAAPVNGGNQAAARAAPANGGNQAAAAAAPLNGGNQAATMTAPGNSDSQAATMVAPVKGNNQAATIAAPANGGNQAAATAAPAATTAVPVATTAAPVNEDTQANAAEAGTKRKAEEEATDVPDAKKRDDKSDEA